MRIWRVMVVGLALGAPAQAVVTCTLSGTPAPLRQGGLSELLGDIVLNCSGAAAGTPMTGALQVQLTAAVTNRVVGSTAPEVKLSVNTASGFVVVPGVQATLVFNSLTLQNINLAFGADGTLALKISGMRAEATDSVWAWIGYTGSPQLSLTTQGVVVGRAAGGTIAMSTTATWQVGVAQLPEEFDFDTLLSLQVPFLSVRVTEGTAGLFQKKQGEADTGVRILVQIPGVTDEAIVVVPDAIAGSTALVPTAGGDLGVAASGGQYEQGSQRSLLLTRVRGADRNGSGGTQAFAPLPGVNELKRVGVADIEQGTWYAVYEVLDADDGALETFQFPAFIVLPPGTQSEEPLLGARVSLAPLSIVRGASPTAPVPRYAANFAGNDCAILGDCTAPYFPQLRTRPESTLTFTAPAGSADLLGEIQVVNAGGSLLQWSAWVSYVDTSGWISVWPSSGLEGAWVRVAVSPSKLAPGTYQATVFIQGTGGAGLDSFPVRLTVTPAPPPTVPAPVLQAVLDATGAQRPVAAGGMAVLLGGGFTAGSTVTFGGFPTQILTQMPGFLTVEVPTPLLRETQAAVVVNTDDRLSTPCTVGLAPVSPAVLFALHEDGTVNSSSHPATAGTVLLLLMTGIRFADQPVFVAISDRVIPELIPLPPDTQTPAAVDLVRFRIPDDLPTMTMSLLVCGHLAEAPDKSYCGSPFPLSLQAK
jgi:hypothetical protein